MTKKLNSVFAVSAAFVLALAGCSSNSQDRGGSSSDSSASSETLKPVTYSTGGQEYYGYNANTPAGYSTYNGVINDRMGSSFGRFLPDGTWKKGDAMGDYEVVSEDPLTVKYTINEKAVYQGGTPITCEDYYMDWVSQNPQWVLDANGGEPLFDNVSSPDTYALAVPEGPQCNAGEKTFTITYSAPNPDYNLVVGGALPSHVVAKNIGMTKEDFYKALKNKDVDVVKKAADYWNNWNSSTTPGQVPDVENHPSFGPFAYLEGGWKATESITLVPNPDWWGDPVGVSQFTVRFLDAQAQEQALNNGDVNVIEPQASTDSLQNLNGMSNVTVETGESMIWEHIDFNFADGSVFADSAGGKNLRQAFALCVPRQQIVDTLIKPLDEKAQVLNLREYFTGDSDYKQVLDAAYDGSYDNVDIDKAKELVAASGVANPTVRLGYATPNPRRANEVAMIADSCAKAGITVKDSGAEDFFTNAITTGNYDAALFAWSGSGQKVSGANIYTTTGQQNYGKYSNATVDEQWKLVQSSLDENVELEAKKVIERELWNDLFGIPLYQHPSVIAYTTGLKNVEHNVTQSGVVWNAEAWTWQ